MALPSTLEGDVNSIKALGHGALSLVNAGIVLAIVAVVLSTRAQTAQAITAFFSVLSWLVGQVIAPLQTVPPLAFSNTLTPAGATLFGSGTAANGSSVPTVTSTGNAATTSVTNPVTGQTVPGGTIGGGSSTNTGVDWVTGGNDEGLGGVGSVSGTTVTGSTPTQYGINPATGQAQLYIP